MYPIAASTSTQIEFSPKSTLNVARQLLLSRSATPLRSTDVGVLSFASTKHNNAYLNGSSEQEDVLKRHSSLLACVGSPAAQQIYKVHKTTASFGLTGTCISRCDDHPPVRWRDSVPVPVSL